MRQPLSDRQTFLAALVLRLSVLAAAGLAWGDARPFLNPDSPEYLRLAAALASGTFEQNGTPEVHRTPGYPLLLVPGAALGTPVAWALLLQAVLGGATAVLVQRTAHVLWGDARAAAAAAAWIAVDPVQLAWGAQVMAEVPLTFCVAASLLALAWAWTGPSGQAALAVGAAALALAAAAHVKPVALAAAAALPLALAVRQAGRGCWRDGLRQATLAAAVLACLLAPWCARNGRRTGNWSFTSKLDRVLAWGVPAALAEQGEPGSYERTRRAHRGEAPEPPPGGRRAAVERLLASPGHFASQHVRGMVRVLVHPGSLALLELVGGRDLGAVRRVVRREGSLAGWLATWHQHRWVAIATALFLAGHLAILGLAGSSIFRARGRAPELAALGLIGLALLAASGGYWGQGRFRHPLGPLLAVSAAAALARRAPSGEVTA